MSTTTTNFNLIKPELTDVADITTTNSNWDTVDTKLKESGDHSTNTSNPHKVTAEQIGAAKVDLSNVNDETLVNKVITAGIEDVPIVTTAGNGDAYTATISKISALKTGLTIIIIPHVVSTSTSPTLNLNDLGAKNIRRRLSNATTSTGVGYNASWLSANKPIMLEYDGTYWIAITQTKPVSSDLSGSVPVTLGGTGATTASAARTNLEITPANIGAVKKSGDKMTGSLNIEKATYPQLTLNATDSAKRLLIQQSSASATLNTYSTAGDTKNYRQLMLQDAASNSNIGSSLRLIDRVDGTDSYYNILTTANAASLIQSLLANGEISGVRMTTSGNIASGASAAVTVTNSSKCLVNLLGASEYNNYLTVEKTSTTKLTITNNGSGVAGYQVVEYY